jgi:DNA helicase HerA-like ATPase
MLTISPSLQVRSTGTRDVILASSGQGKSYLTGVILEETLAAGIPVGIFDPEGEHWPLAELYPMIIVGRDVPMVAEGADLYAKALIELRCPLIFDFAACDIVEEAYPALFAAISQAIFMSAKKHRRFTRLVIDEAHEFAPQGLDDGDQDYKTWPQILPGLIVVDPATGQHQ